MKKKLGKWRLFSICVITVFVMCTAIQALEDEEREEI